MARSCGADLFDGRHGGRPAPGEGKPHPPSSSVDRPQGVGIAPIEDSGIRGERQFDIGDLEIIINFAF